MKEEHRLKALRESAAANEHRYSFDEPDAGVLEAFDNPAADDGQNPAAAHMTIEIEAPEFTTLCPITGQPDFATIRVEYEPDALCVESKSFKLYLLGFRNFGTFHEACVTRICNDLVALLQPHYLRVVGEFTPRGGISFWPVAEYIKDMDDNE